jgi:hypothetical protein
MGGVSVVSLSASRGAARHCDALRWATASNSRKQRKQHKQHKQAAQAALTHAAKLKNRQAPYSSSSRLAT